MIEGLEDVWWVQVVHKLSSLYTAGGSCTCVSQNIESLLIDG
jgi:hypothetical protein